MPQTFRDAQQALGFVVSQTAHIEAEVYRIKYPDITYPQLIPVDTSAHPWATTVTFFSMDSFGAAKWFNGNGRDVPVVGTEQTKFDAPVHMAAIGYGWNIEEINQAQMLGLNLAAEKATMARRAYEEFVETIAFAGDTAKGFKGLFNNTDVPLVSAPNGAGGSPLFANKTPDEIVTDINAVVTGVFTATNTVAIADTVILPFSRFNALASRRLGDTNMTVLEFVRRNNAYTAMTGAELTIRATRQSETAGAGGTARLMAYRRSPEVLKLHIPMPLQFLPAQAIMLDVVVPGMFRLGGLDIRLPKECRYMDGV